MYCKYCGSKNDGGARFCRDCGRAMTGTPPNAGRAAPAHTAVTPGAMQASTKGKTWMWVALGAVLLVVLLFVGPTAFDFGTISEIADPIVDTRPPAPDNASDVESNNPAVVEDASRSTTAPTPLVDTKPPAPDNAMYVWDNATTILSWDASKGAEYYNIYYDDFFDDNCRVSRNGDPSFCDLLASDIRQTSYRHTNPDRRKNYYWVVACNSGVCSDVESENPAVVEDASPSTTAPTASLSPEQSGPSTESDMSRRSFEASTPSGYNRVSLIDNGQVWGVPERFTTDSSLGAVAYLLLGSVKGCSFADEELDRSSIVYVKGEPLGRLSNYESQEVCRMASSAWDTRWNGIRITHLRIFDESSPTNARNYVYDPDGMQYIEASAASGGSN